MQTRSSALVIAGLLAGGLVAGCAAGGSTADAGKVAQTVTRELGDLAAGNGAAACALATPTGQTELASASPNHKCAQAIELVSQNLTPAVRLGLKTAVVKKVTINGGSATVSNADITSTQGSLSGFLGPGSAPTVLTKQPDGSWEIAG
ncbi:MAG TPA: hypothetical protein VIJ51_15070 [Solirubrobacteraceae bacterium]